METSYIIVLLIIIYYLYKDNYIHGGNKETKQGELIKRAKLISSINSSFWAEFYLVEDINGKKFMLKREHVPTIEMEYTLASPIWREYEFCKNLGEKYPQFFLKLVDHRIVNKCSFELIRPDYAYKIILNNPEMKKRVDLVDNSTHCFDKLFEYKGIPLSNWYSSNPEDRDLKYYSIILQLCYMCHLLKQNGYVLNNIHAKNILISNTDKKYIETELDVKIPTNGVSVSISTYSNILHSKYVLTSEEKHILKHKLDILDVLKFLIHNNEFDQYLKSQRIQIIDSNKMMEKFLKTEYSKKLDSTSKNQYVKYFTFQYFHPNEYFELVLGNKYPGKPFKYELENFISESQLNNIVKHTENIPEIIKQLMNNDIIN
jgi:hypothetical protein